MKETSVISSAFIIFGSIPPPPGPNTTGDIPLITLAEIYTRGRSIKAIIANTAEYFAFFSSYPEFALIKQIYDVENPEYECCC